jgi:Icc-related predicted phosphoesterase
MLLIVLSDFHGSLNSLDNFISRMSKFEPDLFVFCGDVMYGHKRGDEWLSAKREKRTADKNLPEIKKEIEQDTEKLRIFYRRLGKIGSEIVAIQGNMDAPKEIVSDCYNIHEFENLHFIHEKALKIGDYTFIGYGGGIQRKKEEFFVYDTSEEDIGKRLELLFQKTQNERIILVTHTPPLADRVDLHGEKHRGSKCLTDIIDKYQPYLVLCGHAHEARTMEVIGNSTIINPGAFKDGNFVFVLINGEIKVIFESLD